MLLDQSFNVSLGSFDAEKLIIPIERSIFAQIVLETTKALSASSVSCKAILLVNQIIFKIRGVTNLNLKIKKFGHTCQADLTVEFGHHSNILETRLVNIKF